MEKLLAINGPSIFQTVDSLEVHRRLEPSTHWAHPSYTL